MKADLQTGAISDQFGITPQTLRNWVRRYSEFFTPQAKGKPGRPAVFNESDQAVVLSIYTMLDDGADWDAIGDKLRTGWREEIMPERAAVIASDTNSAVQLATRAMVSERELLRAEERLQKAEARVAELTDKLIESHDKREKLLERLAEERERAGAAEREVKILRELLIPPQNKQNE